MGMFDTVKVDVPLPDGYVSDDNFQTKDLVNALAVYRIREDGKLWQDRAAWQDADADWPVTLTGPLRFYTYDRRGELPLAPHESERWHEYEATFIDGQLVGEIVRIEEEPEPPAPEYDPEVSGPWSDVDLVPQSAKRRWEPTPAQAEAMASRAEQIHEEEHRKRVASAMEEWDRWEKEDADKDPEAYRLARAIRSLQPPWADGEECGVSTSMVREALDAVRMQP